MLGSLVALCIACSKAEQSGVPSSDGLAETSETADAQRRDRVLEYLQYVGLIDSIDLQVETMRQEYEEYYAYMPGEFWDDPRVADIFDAYKVGLLKGHVEVMENSLSDDDLGFLVEFYSSESGRRAVALGKRLDPILISAASEAGQEFSAAFTLLVEEGAIQSN